MKHVVIAGAGFAGVRTALDLARKFPKNLKITLINTTKFHSFHADLYEVATAILPHEGKINFHELEGTTNIPLSLIFKDKNVELVIDQVAAVYLNDQIIKTKNHTFNYDYLLLALGSTTHYFGIPGAEAFSHPLKTAEDAINIRNDIEEMVRTSQNSVTIAIAGGGFTGVEFAGDLISYLKSLSRVFKKPQGKVLIIESSKNVLNGMPEWAKKKASLRFKKLGIHIHTDCHIQEVQKTLLKCYKDQTIDYDYLIWTTGIKGVTLDGNIKGAVLNKKNQLIVKGDLSLEGFPNVFAAGDVACVMDAEKKNQIPSTARSAYRQGEVVAKNISLLLNKQSTILFEPENPIFVVPIGGKYGLANLFSLKLSGIPVWILKRIISLKYLSSILPFTKSFAIWRKGVRIYLQND